MSSLSFHDGASPKSEESGSDKPPNIVFIMTDDQVSRRWLPLVPHLFYAQDVAD